MSFLLGVEIDNSRIVWIHDSERTASLPVRLTTVVDGQQKADIRFYLKTKDKKHLLTAETIRNLPPSAAGDPSIDIKPRISGKTFYYDVYINGKPAKKGSINLAPYLRTKRPWIIGGAVTALLLLAVVLAFLLIPMMQKPQEQQRAIPEKRPVTETTVPVQEAEPEPQAETQPEPEPAAMPEQTPEPEKETEKAPEPAAPEVIFIESEITDRHAVYFTPDSSVITAEARSDLDSFISSLPAENDFEEAAFELEVRGHCAKYGTEEGRAELSKERALNVYYYLKSEWGIEADSFVSGAGATEPVTLKRDEQHLNRRVDINIKGNITQIKQ